MPSYLDLLALEISDEVVSTSQQTTVNKTGVCVWGGSTASLYKQSVLSCREQPHYAACVCLRLLQGLQSAVTEAENKQTEPV